MQKRTINFIIILLCIMGCTTTPKIGWVARDGDGQYLGIVKTFIEGSAVIDQKAFLLKNAQGYVYMISQGALVLNEGYIRSRTDHLMDNLGDLYLGSILLDLANYPEKTYSEIYDGEIKPSNRVSLCTQETEVPIKLSTDIYPYYWYIENKISVKPQRFSSGVEMDGVKMKTCSREEAGIPAYIKSPVVEALE